MDKFQIGDKVKYVYDDGSFDEGVITGNLRKDGYYPVKFKDYAHLLGSQHVRPSKLKRLKSLS